MAEIGQRRKVAVSQLGKYKTILQIAGLSMMLYRPPRGLRIYRWAWGSRGGRVRRWSPWPCTCGQPGRSCAVRYAINH